MARGNRASSSNSNGSATASVHDSDGILSKMNKLKVGDKVMWRGGFGRDAPQVAVVAGMQVTDEPREKYGDSVEEVNWDLIRENRVAFELTNNKWAYSEQIEPYTGPGA